MKAWKGYSPYEDLLIRLRTSDPAKYYLVKGSQQRFNVDKAYTTGSNSPYHAASTFIDMIKYHPSSNIAFVKIGSKKYWYPMTDAQLAAWMKSQSLGRYYNNYIKLK